MFPKATKTDSNPVLLSLLQTGSYFGHQLFVGFSEVKKVGSLSPVSDSESHGIGCSIFSQKPAQAPGKTRVPVVGSGNDPST